MMRDLNWLHYGSHDVGRGEGGRAGAEAIVVKWDQREARALEMKVGIRSEGEWAQRRGWGEDLNDVLHDGTAAHGYT
jgi:hypothetical protein